MTRACGATAEVHADGLDALSGPLSISFASPRSAVGRSFGLPICELQACGSCILTPRAEWAGAHWIKQDLTVPGPGYLSPNFFVYHDDIGRLTEQLEMVRSSFDPARHLRTFREFHPHLYRGDPEALAGFLSRIEDGTINSGSHVQHERIGL